MKKFLLVCLVFCLMSGGVAAQSTFVPEDSSFERVNNIKIGDNLEAVDNNAIEFSFSEDEQAVQDYIEDKENEQTEGEAALPKDPTMEYIEGKEDDLAAGEAPLPYDPTAPLAPSSPSLGDLAGSSATDPNSIRIGDNFEAVDNTPIEFSFSDDELAVQDYIEGKEDDLAAGEAPLPFDPSAPITTSPGLGVIPGTSAINPNSIQIGDDLNPINTSSTGGGDILPAGLNVEGGDDALNVKNANADSPSQAKSSLAECSGDVFQQIQCKVLQFLSNLRTLAYVLAGFGLIMFAYAAIFNKVNMKHLASIGMGLFLLAMMGPFIEYFSGDSRVTTALGYGNFMGDEFTYVQGSGPQVAVDDSQIPDTSVTNNNTSQIISGLSSSGSSGDDEKEEDKKKYTIGDIINFGKTAARTVKDVKSVVTGTDWSLSNIGGIVSNVQNTITGNQTGFDSINTLAQIATGVLKNNDFSQIDVNSELKTGQNTANQIQDLFSSKTTKQENRTRREQGEDTNVLSNWLGNIGDKMNGNTE